MKSKYPKRMGMTDIPYPIKDMEVRAVTRIGGYWFFDRHFPFLHFERERLFIFTDKSMREVIL